VVGQTTNPLNRKPNVLFVSADSGGCGFYRCFTPAYFLQEQGYCNTRISGLGGAVEFNHIDWADILIFQRIAEPKNAAWHYAAIKDKHLIVENDDLYESVPSKSPAKKFFPRHIINGLHYAMNIADRLTVTTNNLKEKYSRFGLPVNVIQNALDMRIDNYYPSTIKTNGRIVIGYQGSATHNVDFAAAAGAIDSIMQKHPHVVIEALGFFPEQLKKKYPNRIYIRGWQPLHNYFNAIRQLGAHIGIAPIDDIPFNHAKSNLKLVEFGTIRIPWVASKVEPYIKITEKSGGGILVKNRHKDWERALDKLINMTNPERQDMGDKGRKYVEKHHSAEKVAELWYNAIIMTLNGKTNPKRKKLFEKITFNKAQKLQFTQIV
jgi:glycosyltransferase involved in cell wall biosynthesis